jgi:hypothetical protein
MKIECYTQHGVYCKKYYINIIYNNEDYKTDERIAYLLDIEYTEYCNFIKSYHADYYECTGYLFDDENSCDNCIKLLKEKYSDKLICLTLQEH